MTGEKREKACCRRERGLRESIENKLGVACLGLELFKETIKASSTPSCSCLIIKKIKYLIT